jgi:hypothetical protein
MGYFNVNRRDAVQEWLIIRTCVPSVNTEWTVFFHKGLVNSETGDELRTVQEGP